MRRAFVIALIDENKMQQKFGNDFKLINVWNDIIKRDLNDNIMKDINNQNKFKLKYFITKFEERYILNEQIYRWNVAKYPMSSTCNLESLNRSMTAVIGTHPSLTKFCMDINKIIEKSAYKFELYALHGTMDARRKDSRVTLIERDVCFHDSKSIVEYVSRLAALQFRNSNLTKKDMSNTELNLLVYNSNSDTDSDHDDNSSNRNQSNHDDNNTNHNHTNSDDDDNNSTNKPKPKAKKKCKKKTNQKKQSDDDSTSDYKP